MGPPFNLYRVRYLFLEENALEENGHVQKETTFSLGKPRCLIIGSDLRLPLWV